MATVDALYDFREAESHCVITLHPNLNKQPWGEIDGIGNSLLERIRGYMDANRKARAFLVNLADLNYMGSALVALVVRLWKTIKEKDGRMAVVNSDEMVLEVLRLSGLEDVWTICDTADEGLKAIGVRASAVTAPAATGPQPIAGEPANVIVHHVATGRPASVVWCLASLLMLLVSGVGLFLTASNPPPIEDLRIGIGMLFGGALLGLLPATVAVSRGGGMNRAIGAAGILGAIALLVTGVAVHPQRDALFGGTSKEPAQTPHPGTNDKTNHKTPKTKSPGAKTGTSKTTPKAPGRKTGKTSPAKEPKAATPDRTGGPAVAPKPPVMS